MLVVEGDSRQTPPLREGVVLSASEDRRQFRWARPRSAVTVSPNAPGLAPLTGFSRSGTRTCLRIRSMCRPNRLFALLGTSLGLAAVVAYLTKRAAPHFIRPSSLSPETGASSCSGPRSRSSGGM